MKFAKELENNLIPEWRAKYLDYKVGKKKIKAIQRALRNAQSSTPLTPRRRAKDTLPNPHINAPEYSYLNRNTPRLHDASKPPQGQAATNTTGPASASAPLPAAKDFALPTPARKIPSSGYGTVPLVRQCSRLSSVQNNDNVDSEDQETSPLLDSIDHQRVSEDMRRRGLTRYGSIIGSPPRDEPSGRSLRGRGPPSLDLPGPALKPERSRRSQSRLPINTQNGNGNSPAPQVNVNTGNNSNNNNNNNNSDDDDNNHRMPLSLRYRSIFHPKRMNSQPHVSTTQGDNRPMIRRLFSLGNHAHSTSAEFPMAAYKDVDVRQGEFFNFLDMELEKIEDFYKTKEDEATKRLEVLRQQLHIMRDRRMEEVIQARTDAMKAKAHWQQNGNGGAERHATIAVKTGELIDKLDETYKDVVYGKIGKRSKALETLTRSQHTINAEEADGHDEGNREPWNRDYVRRDRNAKVPYHTARRKLKLAMQEYYRGLELLKSYALLNQKAFRKINKKYDKAVNARPSLRYMNEKVNKAYFVTSDVVDGHIRIVEDLYARYFESGNYKVAAGKLRAKTHRSTDYTGVVFRNGIYLALGAVFGVQGLVYAAQINEGSNDATLVTNASYLMQIYGGYFLMLILMLIFILDCRLWNKARVNYAFVFEFDNRSVLDWHELAELPCFLLFLLGFFIWINFSQYGTSSMFIYYPVLLVGITFILLFNPLPILYHQSRSWFLEANWRLFFSGFYPVEFRDFFLGDMFCSLTYSMGNIELFFCLYAHLTTNDHAFQNPGRCNSTRSRLMGFFTTLPGIWRALQCIRRYKDTHNAFPHLANCGKYLMTICYYMSLSLWRIDHTWHLRAVFIFFATVNAVYCSTWDLVMDWSLLDPYSRPKLLRDHLAFKSTWMYYAAMVLDPILRFNWIFYAIYGNEIQHSALLSFFVSLTEVGRRGMWIIFRVENEHCTNISRFRASRDVPLPYKIKKSHEERVAEVATAEHPDRQNAAEDDSEDDDGDEERRAKEEEQRRQGISISPSLSRTRSKSTRPGDMFQRAQMHDFEAAAYSRQQRYADSPMLRAMSFVGSLLHTAHAQDFERKKKDDSDKDADKNDRLDVDEEEDEHDSEATEDDDDEGMDLEAENAARAAKDVEMIAEGSGTSADELEDRTVAKAKKRVEDADAGGEEFTFQPKRQDDDGGSNGGTSDNGDNGDNGDTGNGDGDGSGDGKGDGDEDGGFKTDSDDAISPASASGSVLKGEGLAKTLSSVARQAKEKESRA